MSPIHQKRSKVICENYRGMAETITVSRTNDKLLRNKIDQEYQDY